MLLQLAIDRPDSLPIARQVAEFVDIMEVGTPLLKRFGVAAIRTIREMAPDVPVLADTKTVDGGALEAELVFNAGAMFMTALACAGPATFEAAAEIAEKYGAYVVMDTIVGGMESLDPGAPYSGRCRVVALHAGFDSRPAIGEPLVVHTAAIAEIRTNGYKVALVGGVDRGNLRALTESAPDVIVVGRGITADPDPKGAAEWMRSQMPDRQHGWPWQTR